MRRVSALLFAVAVLSAFAACSKPQVYYPLYHYVGLSATSATATNGKIASYLNWGDKLISSGKTFTVTNSATSVSIYAEVKNTVDGTTGWVDLSKVVTNASARAIVLGQTVAYSTPTVSARNMQSVTPPLLCYILEIKDNEWARILPFQSQSYYLSNITWLPSDLVWLPLKDISTNQSDVDVMVAVQFRTRQYKEAKIAWEQNPNDALLKDKYTKTLDQLKAALQALVQKYPQSGSVKYANELLDAMFPPAVQTETDAGGGGTASGGNEAL